MVGDAVGWLLLCFASNLCAFAFGLDLVCMVTLVCFVLAVWFGWGGVVFVVG